MAMSCLARPSCPTSLGSFLVGAAVGSLGLAVGKEKSRSMLEKSGSTCSVPGLLIVAHMELRSAGGIAVRPTAWARCSMQLVSNTPPAAVLYPHVGPHLRASLCLTKQAQCSWGQFALASEAGPHSLVGGQHAAARLP